jgi:antitoxin component YwqK of YwqJK toxin-antitoxin module
VQPGQCVGTYLQFDPNSIDWNCYLSEIIFMKVFFLSICMVSAAWPVLSQSDNEKIVAYFDSDWKPVDDSVAAISYFRTVVPYGSHVIVKDYSLSGVKLMQAECSQYMPGLVKDGQVTYYYNNGSVKEEGVYKDDEKQGVFHYYSRTGEKQEEREYDGKKMRYLQAYDEAGEQPVDARGPIVERTENHSASAHVHHDRACCVVRVAPQFGPWIPTPYNGKLMPSSFALPIEFKLGR